MSDPPPPLTYEQGDCRAPDNDIEIYISPFLAALEGGGAGSSAHPHKQINPYFRVTKVAQMTPRMDVEPGQARPTKNPRVTVGHTSMGPPAPKPASRKRPAAEIALECDEEFVDPPVSISDMFDAGPPPTTAQPTTGCALTELYDMNLTEALLGDRRVVQLV